MRRIKAGDINNPPLSDNLNAMGGDVRVLMIQNAAIVAIDSGEVFLILIIINN